MHLHSHSMFLSALQYYLAFTSLPVTAPFHTRQATSKRGLSLTTEQTPSLTSNQKPSLTSEQKPSLTSEQKSLKAAVLQELVHQQAVCAVRAAANEAHQVGVLQFAQVGHLCLHSNEEEDFQSPFDTEWTDSIQALQGCSRQ